ncbi:hypothetical protein GCM10023194_80820 [Planotetraspora phitsanulokensis]|uniref:Uncharacterized protein n=1 Tax=Planotetraspora phitsanulokensis TaxID=575192 RepID=A0A8J3UE49_9ACTN|nr:hypothetical protein [Planotetraspora phitsanulokensis]GII42836.1 hypothetical protein Pph01_78390 [Planotetraspora phitsanulokensis]
MTRHPDGFEDAMKALAHRVWKRDQLDPDDRPSPTDFAFEFMTAMTHLGWKLIPITPPRTTGATGPEVYARGAAMVRQALPIRTAPEVDGGGADA